MGHVGVKLFLAYQKELKRIYEMDTSLEFGSHVCL